tara:strand:- start:78537 stop:79172 length:636 start_codon:yes stop_codon:yes gene_type:complete
MMTPKTQTIVASTVISLCVLVSLALIPMKPQGSAIVLGMMLFFLIVWNAVKALALRKCNDLDWLNSKTRHEILFAIILASLLGLGSITSTLGKELGFFDSNLVQRIAGVNIGLLLIVMGNYMPKKNQASASQCGCGSKPCSISGSKSSSSTLQRFMGWTFVLAGLLYTIAWIVLDLDQAGIAILFAFPVAIASIFVVRYLSSRRSKPTIVV